MLGMGSDPRKSCGLKPDWNIAWADGGQPGRFPSPFFPSALSPVSRFGLSSRQTGGQHGDGKNQGPLGLKIL